MTRSKFFSWFLKPWHLWVTIFVYTIIAGLFVQLILLPYIFPSLHFGYGLLIGLDGGKFHRIALDLAQKISESGWSQWELLPQGQIVSGIAAIFYVLIYPMPWSVLPVNGILNASACTILYLLITRITGNKRLSLIGSLPFFFFPSNLLWNTQFHNENYVVPSVIFVLFGWLLVLDASQGKQKIISWASLLMTFLIILGSSIIGLARQNIITLLAYSFALVSLLIVIIGLIKKGKLLEKIVRSFLPIFFSVIMVLISNLLNNLYVQDTSASVTVSQTAKNNKWDYAAWLPDVIENEIAGVARFRRTFVKSWAEGGSAIDLEVKFNNVGDVVRYIPRAAQIAFLAPFPDMWFSEGKKVTGTAMRIASAFEMMIVYLCYPGLLLFLWKYRRSAIVWVILFVCTAVLLVYALTIPNIGALYRFRYPYLMPLVCFGLVGWLNLFPQKGVRGEEVSIQ